MGTPLTEDQFSAALRDFSHTAFRLELQPAYDVASERDTVARFLRGDPQPPTEVPGLRDWFAQVAAQTAEGRRVERVRVHEDPPTDYQRWERWIGQWNADAGERLHYLTRKRAHDIGLLPAAGDRDWWLFDSQHLVVMTYDSAGRRIRTELETDPATIVQACAWRDLAVHGALNQGDAPPPPRMETNP